MIPTEQRPQECEHYHEGIAACELCGYCDPKCNTKHCPNFTPKKQEPILRARFYVDKNECGGDYRPEVTEDFICTADYGQTQDVECLRYYKIKDMRYINVSEEEIIDHCKRVNL